MLFDKGLLGSEASSSDMAGHSSDQYSDLNALPESSETQRVKETADLLYSLKKI